MNEEEQLLTTGRVIDATRKIESKLVACGATGSGLREKAESLGERLPDEAARLIRFIGSVRNRVAHESSAMLRPDELALFEEATQAVLTELDKFSPPEPSTGTPPAALLKTTPPPTASEGDGIGDETHEEVGTKTNPSAILPPWNSPIWSALPGLHLVYAFRAGWNAFGAGQLFLLLSIVELLGFVLLGFAAGYRSPLLAAGGGALCVAVYLCGLWLGLREKKGFGLYLVPVANLVWFFRRITTCLEPTQLIVATAILGIWLAAIRLLLEEEFIASGITAMISWGGAIIDSFLRRR